MNYAKDKQSLILGIILVLFWGLDAYDKIVILHAPYRLLWFSSAGLLMTSLGLLTKNRLLVTMTFCALSVVEGVWFASFLLSFFHLDFIGMASYHPSARLDATIVTAYHILLFPSLLLAISKVRPHKKGWLAAGVFALSIGILSYIFTLGLSDNVNCIQSDKACSSFFSLFYSIHNPQRIIIAALAITGLIFYPVNKALFWFELKK